MNSPCRNHPEQGPGSHARLLDHQDCRHDAGRNRRRHRHDDARTGAISSARALFLAVLVVLGHRANRCAKKFHPFLYWATIVASTTFGTTMADFADRSLGIGYTGGSIAPVRLPDGRRLASGIGRKARSRSIPSTRRRSRPSTGRRSRFRRRSARRSATGLADTGGLGYEGGALVFAAGLAVVAGLYFWTTSRACCCSGRPSS